MELLRRTKAGDQEARRELIEGNLRLVLSSSSASPAGARTPATCFQVGCVGLIKAIDNFDINQPVRFSTYGVLYDHRRDPPISPGQQRHPGVPLHAGHGL